MLEDDIINATKQMVATTLDSQHYDGSKRKRGQDEQDIRDKRDHRDSRRTNHHIEARDRDRAPENSRQDNSTKHTSPTR